MKKTIVMVFAVLLSITASFAQEKTTAHKYQHQGKTTTKYTCTMHPEVIRSKPGKCPKCGMALVPVKRKTKTAKTMGDMKM